MPRNKLKKYSEIDTFPNVIHRPNALAGRWSTSFFKNRNPISIELGCGTGVMTYELAQRHRGRNYIGIDNKRARVWVGAQKALVDDLTNVAFITTRIETLKEYFRTDEISEVWIPFPDPYPKPSKSNKRLISPQLLEMYRNFISRNCIFHFKTDDRDLFDYTLSLLRKENAGIEFISENIHADPSVSDDVKIKTTYEQRHLQDGKIIKYIRFTIY